MFTETGWFTGWGLALAAPKGLREYGGINAGQKQRGCRTGNIWLKSLSISCYNLANG